MTSLMDTTHTSEYCFFNKKWNIDRALSENAYSLKYIQ